MYVFFGARLSSRPSDLLTELTNGRTKGFFFMNPKRPFHFVLVFLPLQYIFLRPPVLKYRYMYDVIIRVFPELIRIDYGRRLLNNGEGIFNYGRRIFNYGRRIFNYGRRIFNYGRLWIRLYFEYWETPWRKSPTSDSRIWKPVPKRIPMHPFRWWCWGEEEEEEERLVVAGERY